MKDKKIVPFAPKPVKLEDKSQAELIEERRKNREGWLSKLRKKKK